MRLAQARESAGLTQGQAAKLLGVSRVLVTKAESGETPVRELLLRGFAQIYGVSAAWLATGATVPHNLPEAELAKLTPADRTAVAELLGRLPDPIVDANGQTWLNHLEPTDVT